MPIPRYCASLPYPSLFKIESKRLLVGLDRKKGNGCRWKIANMKICKEVSAGAYPRIWLSSLLFCDLWKSLKVNMTTCNNATVPCFWESAISQKQNELCMQWWSLPPVGCGPRCSPSAWSPLQSGGISLTEAWGRPPSSEPQTSHPEPSPRRRGSTPLSSSRPPAARTSSCCSSLQEKQKLSAKC